MILVFTYFCLHFLWYFVSKIVPTYCEKKTVLVIEKKKWKFEAEGQEFAKNLRSPEKFIHTVKCWNNFWNRMLLWRFLRWRFITWPFDVIVKYILWCYLSKKITQYQKYHWRLRNWARKYLILWGQLLKNVNLSCWSRKVC